MFKEHRRLQWSDKGLPLRQRWGLGKHEASVLNVVRVRVVDDPEKQEPNDEVLVRVQNVAFFLAVQVNR